MYVLYTSTKRYCNQETWPPAVSEIYIYNKYLGFVFNQEAGSPLALKTKICQMMTVKQKKRKENIARLRKGVLDFLLSPMYPYFCVQGHKYFFLFVRTVKAQVVIYNYYYYFFYLIFTKHLKATADCLKRHKVGKKKLLRVAYQDSFAPREKMFLFRLLCLICIYICIYFYLLKQRCQRQKHFRTCAAQQSRT